MENDGVVISNEEKLHGTGFAATVAAGAFVAIMDLLIQIHSFVWGSLYGATIALIIMHIVIGAK